jgi:hypothetical protein
VRVTGVVSLCTRRKVHAEHHAGDPPKGGSATPIYTTLRDVPDLHG